MSGHFVCNRATTDIANIWLYVAEDRPSAADSLVNDFHATFEMLARNPRLGEARPRLGKRVRAFTVRGYVIYFRPTSDGIDIIRVVHGARRLKRLDATD